MKKSYSPLVSGIAFGLLVLPTVPVLGQAPTISGLVPGRQAVAAPRTGAVALTFSQAVNGASGIHIFSNQWGGYRTGAASGDGTATLRVQPTQVFAPGEEVSVTVPATVRGAAPGGAPLAAGQVLQFRAAGGPALGTFTAGPGSPGTSEYYYQFPNLVDINSDGRLDLVYLDPPQNVVKTRLGDGLGAFGPVLTGLYLSSGSSGLCVADVNNDGKPDLIINAPGGSNFLILIALGDGQGNFAATTAVPVGPIVVYVQTADMNADGNLDLVFETDTFVASPSGPANSTLNVCLGDGQGHFTALPATPISLGAGGLCVADANNDGYLDCLVANSSTGQLKTYLGDGRGGLALATTPTLTIPVSGPANAYPNPDSVVPLAADFTGDGNVDVLVLDRAANAIRLHPGTGQGDFGPATVLSAAGLFQAQAADLDGDGDLDLLGASADYTNLTAYYWRNNGSGAFAAQPNLPGAATRLATGDINNDGAIDVVALDERGSPNGPTIHPCLNQPLASAPVFGTFSPAQAPAGTTVTITGTNLTGATTVLVGGVPVTGFTVVNGTTITFVMPVGLTGGLITVLTPTGAATSRLALRGTLAVRTTASSLAVQLYPNPASSTVQLLLPADAPAGPLQATFYNSLGQRVRSANAAVVPGFSTELDLTGLAPGLYTLRLQLGSRLAVRQLVVE